MNRLQDSSYCDLDISNAIWTQIFTVAPLVVIGTKEGDNYDLAPKHMAMPIGDNNYYGFVCTPKHSTYHNIKETKEFTVSFPIPDQVVLASLSASPRCDDKLIKPIVGALPSFKASSVDALCIAESYLILECKLFKVIDGFNQHSIITGAIVAAHCHKDYLKVFDNDHQQQLRKREIVSLRNSCKPAMGYVS